MTTTFLSLYRGETITTARLVAVSSDREIVNKFIRELAGDEQHDEQPEPLQVVRGGDEE